MSNNIWQYKALGTASANQQ